MELETVCRVPVRDLRFEVCRQVDYVDGSERAFFHADSTADA